MSLTNFIKKDDVREKIDSFFNKPKFSANEQIKVALPSTYNSSDYGLIGTAFDYLFRFYLSHKYRDIDKILKLKEDTYKDISIENFFKYFSSSLCFLDVSRKFFKSLLKKHSYYKGLTIGEIIEKSDYVNEIYSGKAWKVRRLTVNINGDIVTIYADKNSSGKYKLFQLKVEDEYKRQYLRYFLNNLTRKEIEQINDKFNGNLSKRVKQIKIRYFDKPRICKKIVEEYNNMINLICRLIEDCNWVAYNSLEKINLKKLWNTQTQYEELYNKVKKLIANAEKNYANFMINGVLTDELLKSVIDLAKIDEIYRSSLKCFNRNLEEYNKDRLKDLKKLYQIISIPKEDISNAYLNPTFGEGSKLVGGADGDLIVDNLLIDVKTTKNIKFSIKYWRQLVGYLTLIDIQGKYTPINQAGIYFSRYGYYFTFNTERVYHHNKYNEFKKWFIQKAEASF